MKDSVRFIGSMDLFLAGDYFIRAVIDRLCAFFFIGYLLGNYPLE
jgi:hypothetical protein